ncbi:MAG: hypothetical protein ACXACA_04140 [Candidatus Ranarchaeia archaeon]|jgi:hypothetical protein
MQKKFALPLILLVIMLPLFLLVLDNFFRNVAQIHDVLKVIPGDVSIYQIVWLLLSPLIRGPTSTDLMVVLLLVPLGTIFFAVVARPMANLMVRLHGLIRLGKYDYKVEKLGEEFGLGDFLKRAIYPSLFCLTLGLTQTQNIINNFAIHKSQLIATITAVPLAFVFGLLMVPVAALLWGPIWVLEDSGIVAYLKPEQSNRRQTPDTEGVGRYFRTYLNGFVGVSTLIGLGSYLYSSIIIQLDFATRIQAIFGLVVMFLIPFYAVLAFSPLLLIHERNFLDHREKLTKSLVNQEVIPSPESSPSEGGEKDLQDRSESPQQNNDFTEY